MTTKKNLEALIAQGEIDKLIITIRGRRVMLDEDLAELYELETKLLIRSVRRNLDRFPPDFMFQLSDQEVTNLRIQFGSSRSWGGRRTNPYAFTEHGVLMLSSVLNSKRAIQVNIAIMRAFVRLRELVVSHDVLSRRLDQLEKKYDAQFKVVVQSIRELMKPVARPNKRRLGF